MSVQPLPGYKEIKPFVYAGFFPVSNEDYNDLKDAIEKLSLSESALQFEPENSPVLGFGVRIGFLGLLHMDIIETSNLSRQFLFRSTDVGSSKSLSGARVVQGWNNDMHVDGIEK